MLPSPSSVPLGTPRPLSPSCSLCPRYVTKWDGHKRCYQHRYDCTAEDTCDVCLDWDIKSWSLYACWLKTSRDLEEKRKAEKGLLSPGGLPLATGLLKSSHGKGKGPKILPTHTISSSNPPLVTDVPSQVKKVRNRGAKKTRRLEAVVDGQKSGPVKGAVGQGTGVSMGVGFTAETKDCEVESKVGPVWLTQDSMEQSDSEYLTVSPSGLTVEERGIVVGDRLISEPWSQDRGEECKPRSYVATKVVSTTRESPRCNGSKKPGGSTGRKAVGKPTSPGVRLAPEPQPCGDVDPVLMGQFFTMFRNMMETSALVRVPPTVATVDSTLVAAARPPLVENLREPAVGPPRDSQSSDEESTHTGDGSDGALGPVPLMRIPKRKAAADLSLVSSKRLARESPDETESSNEDEGVDRDSSGESVDGDDGTLLYPARLALVWQLLSDDLPDKSLAAGKRVGARTTSALSGESQKEESKEPALPLSGLARSSLNKWMEKAQDPVKGALPLGKYPKPEKISGHESTCSRDFQIGHAEYLKSTQVDTKMSSEPASTLQPKTLQYLEEQSRRGIIAASTKEWLLMTIKHLMDLLMQNMIEVQTGKARINPRRFVEHMKMCQDLLQSVGKSSETVMDTLTYVLNTVTLIRRDQVLRKLPKLPVKLIDELRTAQIVKIEGDDLTGIEPPTSLFVGLEPKITEENEKISSNMVKQMFTHLQVKSTEPKTPRRQNSKKPAAATSTTTTKKRKAKKFANQESTQPTTWVQKPKAVPKAKAKGKGKSH